MDEMRSPSLFHAGTVAIFVGIAIGAVAAWLALTPVLTGGVSCGTIVNPVYPSDMIHPCLDASAGVRTRAYFATSLGLLLLLSGCITAVVGARRPAYAFID